MTAPGDWRPPGGRMGFAPREFDLSPFRSWTSDLTVKRGRLGDATLPISPHRPNSAFQKPIDRLLLHQGVFRLCVTLTHRYLSAEFDPPLLIDPDALDPNQVTNFHHIFHVLHAKVG
jgi:hypothetical protein